MTEEMGNISSKCCRRTEMMTEEMDTDSSKARFILRQLKIKNFIRFKEEQKCMHFTNNGPYLIIGQNQSGKSSIFEAVRRCLSSKENITVSSIPDESKSSIVVCRYISNGENTGGQQKLYTFYMHRTVDRSKFIKGCVIVNENSDILDFGIDCVDYIDKNIRSHWKLTDMNCHSKATTEKCEECTYCFRNITTDCDLKLNEIERWVDHLSQTFLEHTDDCSPTTCEQLIDLNLKDHVVFTFPSRGIGNVQWTRSPLMTNGEQNYADASRRSEVINWFLNTYNRQEHSQVKEKEKEYYDYITNGEGGLYELPDDGNSILVRKGKQRWPILKQSEGFTEAKICSILLAVDEFTTVILEDPTIGMHIQMIERLGYLIEERVKNKVVIISTHNQGLLKPHRIANLFILQKISEDPPSSIVIPGGDILGDEMSKYGFPSSISEKQFAYVVLADTILLVEGLSDELFLECFVKLMRSEDNHHYGTVEGACQNVPKEGTPKLSGLCVLPMSSVDEETKYESLCKLLQKKCAFLVDRDDKEDKTSTSDKFVWKVKNLEVLFFKALKNLQENGVDVSEIQNIIIKTCNLKGKKCVTIDGGTITQVEDPGKKSKMFIHGNESYEERLVFLKYLLDQCKPGNEFASSVPGQELQRLREFVLNLSTNKSQKQAVVDQNKITT